jgi:hypothetical protein
MNAPCYIENVVIPEMQAEEVRAAAVQRRFEGCRADMVTTIKNALTSGQQVSLFGKDRDASRVVADSINTEQVAWLIDRSFKANTEEEIASAAMLLIDTAIFEAADAHADWYCFRRPQ